MTSTKLTICIVTVILIAGGGIYGFLAKTSVKDVAYYNDHPDIRKEVIAQCDNNAVLDKEDGNCINAKRSLAKSMLYNNNHSFPRLSYDKIMQKNKEQTP